MTNFRINFTNAWWLLLLIPAVALTLISYFKLNKRYRRTRNRVVSITLHLVIMLLSIALLAGMTAEYYTPNTEIRILKNSPICKRNSGLQKYLIRLVGPAAALFFHGLWHSEAPYLNSPGNCVCKKPFLAEGGTLPIPLSVLYKAAF